MTYNILDFPLLRKNKIKYLSFGIVILILSLTLFFLEMFIPSGVYKAIDVVFSISMFVDMGLGVIYILKFWTLRTQRSAVSLFNLKNAHLKDGKIYTKMTWLKVVMALAVPLNISGMVLYGLSLYYNGANFYYVFSMVLSVIIFIVMFVSFIFLDDEIVIYEKIC